MISWDDLGRVKIKNDYIDGSNIVDLLTDLVRERKHYNPSGWKDFALAMREIDLPEEMIGNNKRRRFIKNIQNEDVLLNSDSVENPFKTVRRSLNFSNISNSETSTPQSRNVFLPQNSDSEQCTISRVIPTRNIKWTNFKL